MKQNIELYKALQKEVDNYFNTNNLSTKSNTAMIYKSIFWIWLLLISYGCYLWVALSSIEFITVSIIIGISLVGIAFNVMHDENHDAYSNNKNINKRLGYLMNVPLWLTRFGRKIQHNVIHHNETNIHGHDGDLEATTLIRFTQYQDHKRFHKYQHIYAWLLYAGETLEWFAISDFTKINKYAKLGKMTPQTLQSEVLILIATKILHIWLFVIIPLIVTSHSWVLVVWGFIMMHIVMGFISSVIFQLAHITHEVQIYQDINIKSEKGFLQHQLETTANFCPDNKRLSWCIGGLNFQIEHHLFRHICHIHYPQIAPIVQEFCKQHWLPYHTVPSFQQAIALHQQELKELWKK